TVAVQPRKPAMGATNSMDREMARGIIPFSHGNGSTSELAAADPSRGSSPGGDGSYIAAAGFHRLAPLCCTPFKAPRIRLYAARRDLPSRSSPPAGLEATAKR